MKNAYQISVEELMEEISVLIQDEIVAQFQKEKNCLNIEFLNGQKFCVTIEEVK